MERNESMELVEVFMSEQDSQRRALNNEMMATLKEMVNIDNLSKKKNATRASIASISNLALYLTAHTRLMSSFMRDIADGKIYKTSRKMKKRNTKKPGETNISDATTLLPEANKENFFPPLPPPMSSLPPLAQKTPQMPKIEPKDEYEDYDSAEETYYDPDEYVRKLQSNIIDNTLTIKM